VSGQCCGGSGWDPLPRRWFRSSTGESALPRRWSSTALRGSKNSNSKKIIENYNIKLKNRFLFKNNKCNNNKYFNK
jgi:hypothetical protein